MSTNGGRSEGHVRVAVIGAGFSGLAVASRLRKQGIEDFVVLERAQEVGGVWRDNTYPGAACDVPSHFYSLSFAPNPSWERSFSSGAQIKGYLERVVEDRGLRPWLRMGEEVLDAAWDDPAGLWRIETSSGRLSADVLVSCAGPLTEPVYPDLPGLDKFRGKTFHSNRWDHEHDLTGERVAVIGTGASAVQLVPEIQPKVGELVVFQRTPGWVVPRMNRRISRIERALMRAFPKAVRIPRLGQFLVRELLYFPMIRRNPVTRRVNQALSRAFLRLQVRDPELRAKLAPNYEIGCKRVLLTNDWYPAITAPNARVVPSAVSEIRERSLVAADGSEHEVDTIVFATGFETAESPIYKRVRGRAGESLHDMWKGRPVFHRATTVAGFPNFFNVCGPGTGSGHGSMIWKLECQTAYISDALRVMDERGIARVDVRPEVQDDYMRWVHEDVGETVWARGGCESWYLDADGTPSMMWPRTMTGFRRMLRRFDVEHYTAEADRGARAEPVGA